MQLFSKLQRRVLKPVVEINLIFSSFFEEPYGKMIDAFVCKYESWN